MDYLTTHTSILPIRAWVRARLGKLQKGCTRLAAASDNVYQLLVHGRWFSPGTPASSTTKTGRHDIAEILLKVALNTINQIKPFCMKPPQAITIMIMNKSTPLSILFQLLLSWSVFIGGRKALECEEKIHIFQA